MALGGTGWARPELLVETDWLADHLHDPNVRILDCRYYFDRDARQVYAAGHIPGALYCSWSQDLTRPGEPVANLLTPPERFAAAMGRFGVGNDTFVVAYDDEGGHSASRIWWELAYYGHDRCAILHGGIAKWLAEGRPVTADVPSVDAASFVPGPGRPEMRASAEDIRDHLTDPAVRVVDVRRESEYTGAEVRAARGGHVPGVAHRLWRDNVEADWTLKPAEELREAYQKLAVAPDQRVITYCQGGVRAAHTALVLSLLGYPDVAVYDGSWADWGNRQDLPVER